MRIHIIMLMINDDYGNNDDDDDVFVCFIVSQDALLDMVACCTSSEKVGLVHQLPFVCDRNGFASVLEKVALLFCSILIW